MKTSCYRKHGNHPNAVSIAGRAPEAYKGREFKKLAPKFLFFKLFKQGYSETYYKYHFYEEVLGVLDPRKVYEELGEDAILLCWEQPGEFCHRRLVAQWLEEALDIEIEEI